MEGTSQSQGELGAPPLEFGIRSKSGFEIYDREEEPERKDSGPRGICRLLIVRETRKRDHEELRER